MIYIILYRRKDVLERLQTRAYVETCTTRTAADELCQTVAATYRCPAWVVESDEPKFKSPLRLAADEGRTITNEDLEQAQARRDYFFNPDGDGDPMLD